MSAKRRYTAREDGVLEDREGNILGRIVAITIEPVEMSLFPDGSLGAMGESSSSGEGTVDGDERPPTPSKGTGDEVREVWDHYVATMKPRSAILHPAESKLIRDALKVGTADELKRCITKCSHSAFHMGQNDRHKKYNKLSQIIKGRQGKETTRERIDYWLDIPERESEGTTMGQDNRITRRQVQVVEMYATPNSVAAQERGRDAMAWLHDHADLKPIVSEGRVTGWERVAE